MALSISIQGDGGNGESGHAADMQMAARHIAEVFPGGVTGLARKMDMSASTLDKKINPDNTQYKLSIHEALLMQQVSGRHTILQAMAANLNRTCLPATPDQSGGDPVEAFMRYQCAAGSFAAAVADGQLEPTTSRNAHRRVEFMAQELIATISALVSISAARVPKR